MTSIDGRVRFRPTRFVLPNGLTVLHQENPGSPAVTMSLRFAAGAAFETSSTQGLAGFCAAMLKRGTEKRTKFQIGEHLDFTGALLGSGSTRHTAYVGAKSRVVDFKSTLELLGECAASASFPVSEIEKLRGDILTAIQEDRDDTRQITLDMLRAMVYAPEHPYAWRLLGTNESIQAVDRPTLVDFYRSHFGPGGAVLVVVGGIGADSACKAVESKLADWTTETGAQDLNGGGLAAALPNIPDAPGPEERTRKVQTMRNKAQADVVIGHPGLRRLDDDYYAAVVMNMILGSFAMGGRLGRNIREEKGMAYYAYSSLGAGVGPGPFVVRAGVHPDNVDAAVDAAFEEIERIRREPVSEEELADAQSAIVRSMPRNLETNEGMASALHSIEQYQLGLDYLERFAGFVDAVDVEQILATAEKRLHPDRCAVTVAGPYPRIDAGGAKIT